MEIHKTYGPSIIEKAWVPAPGYIMRRSRILNIIKFCPLRQLLEIGCGAGILLKEFSDMGFICTALESSDTACQLAIYVNRNNPNVKIYSDTQDCWENNFDYLAAFEVLEHIEDDLSVLKNWNKWLKPRGILLLSVPAHKQMWSDSDVWAGHFRRYEKDDLIKLLEQAGFSIERIENHGFPLGNLIAPVRAWHHAKQLKKRNKKSNKEEQQIVNNAQSGVERTLECKLYPLQASWIGTKIIQFFLFLQNIFISTDLGNGYLVLAKKQ